MAAHEKPEKGRKVSVWFSGAELDEMRRRGLTPADVKRLGLLAGDPVELPHELEPALEMVALLAQALAHGAKVIYPKNYGDGGFEPADLAGAAPVAAG